MAILTRKGVKAPNQLRNTRKVKISRDRRGAGSGEQKEIQSLDERMTSAEGDIEDLYEDKIDRSELSAVTIYVDYENGSDSKDGSTAANAVKTVEGALALCQASEEITLIFTSDYTDDISIGNRYATLFLQSADSTDPITITGLVEIRYIPSVVISDIIFTGSSTSQVLSVSHTRAIIKNCSITNTSTSGNAFALTVSNCSAEIRNCTVLGRRAIQVSGAAPVIIRAESEKTCSITATLDYLFSGMASLVFIQTLVGTVNLTYPTAYTDNTGARKTILIDVDGVLQNQPIPECPATTDGTFVLKASVSSGTVTYSWTAES